MIAAQAMMIEMARIRLHGFSAREVDQARASMMSEVESAYIERDQDYSQVGHAHPQAFGSQPLQPAAMWQLSEGSVP